MSELKVNSIKGVAASTAAITVNNTDGSCTANITNSLSNRNLLDNGAMRINQRGTVANAGNEYGGPDRWKFMKNDGAFTVSQDTDVPAGEGFSNSYKIDCTSGVYYVHLLQYIEGQDLQRVKKGTSNAEQLTISFWIKSTKTGTYVVELYDQDNTRHTSKSYTVDTSNDWEKKTVTFAADTTGTFGNDNQASLRVILWFYAGSSFQGGTLAGTWAANVSANRAAGQVNAFDDTANNVFVTGVQLETGAHASEFEFKSYTEDLSRCQRYYYLHVGGSNTWGAGGSQPVICLFHMWNTGSAFGFIPFPVTMRAAPTASFGLGTDYVECESAGTTDFCNVITVNSNQTHKNGARPYIYGDLSYTAGNAGLAYLNHNDAYVAFTADL